MTVPDEDPEDPWLVQFLAGLEAKAARGRALAWGCLVPLLLIPILVLLALINPH